MDYKHHFRAKTPRRQDAKKDEDSLFILIPLAAFATLRETVSRIGFSTTTSLDFFDFLSGLCGFARDSRSQLAFQLQLF